MFDQGVVRHTKKGYETVSCEMYPLKNFLYTCEKLSFESDRFKMSALSSDLDRAHICSFRTWCEHTNIDISNFAITDKDEGGSGLLGCGFAHCTIAYPIRVP